MQEVEVDSSLEYKALPSGLHNVEQDLVYAALRSLMSCKPDAFRVWKDTSYMTTMLA